MKRGQVYIKSLFLIIILLVLGVSLASAGEKFSLSVTEEHPFLIEGRWVQASQLQVGDLMTTVDGKKARITGIKDVALENPVDVYNLEAGTYSDFVVDGGVVVHNSNKLCTGEKCKVGDFCFAKDTKITMVDGTFKDIQNIKEGDKILSWDFQKNKSAEGIVRKLIISSHKDIYLINNKIKVTSEHPFFTKEKEWAAINPGNTLKEDGFEVKELKVGYHFIDRFGNYIEVFSIIPDFWEITTYNLEIENYHNYFAEEVLVHNQCQKELEKALKTTETEAKAIDTEAKKIGDDLKSSLGHANVDVLDKEFGTLTGIGSPTRDGVMYLYHPVTKDLIAIEKNGVRNYLKAFTPDNPNSKYAPPWWEGWSQITGDPNTIEVGGIIRQVDDPVILYRFLGKRRPRPKTPDDLRSLLSSLGLYQAKGDEAMALQTFLRERLPLIQKEMLQEYGIKPEDRTLLWWVIKSTRSHGGSSQAGTGGSIGISTSVSDNPSLIPENCNFKMKFNVPARNLVIVPRPCENNLPAIWDPKNPGHLTLQEAQNRGLMFVDSRAVGDPNLGDPEAEVTGIMRLLNRYYEPEGSGNLPR